MQLSKLTFSLASLVLIMGLVFATAPVMAQIDVKIPVDPAADTDPTVAFTTPLVTVSDGSNDLAAGGYLIVGRATAPTDAATAAAVGLPWPLPAIYIEAGNTLPDLDELFNELGGTILLNARKSVPTVPADEDSPYVTNYMFDANGAGADGGNRDLKAGDLYITEIMWGINKAQAGTGNANNRQWIEIYNNSGQIIAEEALAGLQLVFEGDRPAPDKVNTASTGHATATSRKQGYTTLDRVSNVVGNGWVNDLGQSGSQAEATPDDNSEPFISMYRDSRGDRGRQIGGGESKGSWKQSTETYLANHVGTPGAAERTGPRTFGASGVALTVIFNEIANFGGGGNYEWIELRIKSGDPHFENWVVDMVHGADDRAVDEDPTQDRLFKMPKLNTGRYDNILLITKQDPAGDPGHPLAAGYNVEMNDADQNSGIDRNIRYYVADDWTIDLPNHGKFVLILRNGADKTNHEKIQDIAGYHPNLKKTTDAFNSDLWPLIGYPAANRTNNQISSGIVQRRQFDDIPGTLTKNANQNDKTALRDDDNRYKGVGYKRSAAANNQHGGTPGYPNNAFKGKESDLADGMVTISEIMYQRGNRLPQWIELHNGSKTQAINLNEWKLKIETNTNDADVDIRKPAVTIQFGGTMIPPNGTVILTSTKATQATDDINVNHQIIDFWTTGSIKSALEVASVGRRYQLLSETAFKLTLMQKGGDVVDVAGNLGADGEAMWALPMMAEDAEGRSSIIRRYNTGPVPGGGDNAGAAQDGMMPVWSGNGSLGDAGGVGNAGWVLASDDLQFEATYYGARDDMSTPGYRGGSPLPVSLSKFRPERQADSSIVVRWATESELDNAGFNILRSETRDGQFTKLNAQLIEGHGTTSERNTYDFVDTTAKPNVVYYYQIQDVSLDGDVTTLRTTHLRGNVSAAGKLTTIWGELKLQD